MIKPFFRKRNRWEGWTPIKGTIQASTVASPEKVIRIRKILDTFDGTVSGVYERKNGNAKRK